jgi:hypothetical protein
VAIEAKNLRERRTFRQRALFGTMGSEVRILSLRPTTDSRSFRLRQSSQKIKWPHEPFNAAALCRAGLAQRVDLRHVPLRTPCSKRQAPRRRGIFMDVLVIDVGGTHVKILSTGQSDKREFASGPKMTAEQMVTTLCRSAIPARFCTIGR